MHPAICDYRPSRIEKPLPPKLMPLDPGRAP
jgi:hypothetical protein